MRKDRQTQVYDVRWHLDMAKVMCNTLLDDIKYWVGNIWYIDKNIKNIIFQLEWAIAGLKVLY